MAYNPMLYNPYGQTQSYSWSQPIAQQAAAQTMNNLIFVTGSEGANALPMGPNSKVVAFDENRDVMYFVTTDGGGYKTIKEFDFSPRVHDKHSPAGTEYVTREQLDELQAGMEQLAAAVEGLAAQEAPKGGRTRRKEADNA